MTIKKIFMLNPRAKTKNTNLIRWMDEADVTGAFSHFSTPDDKKKLKHWPF